MVPLTWFGLGKYIFRSRQVPSISLRLDGWGWLGELISETPMTEERKFAILMAATILSARRIQESMMSSKPDMAKQFYIDKAIEEAAFILERIDKRWPVRKLFPNIHQHSKSPNTVKWKFPDPSHHIRYTISWYRPLVVCPVYNFTDQLASFFP
jgi:hypothetical protein